MKAYCLLHGAALLLSCSPDVTPLRVVLVVAADPDPFQDVVTLRITAGGPRVDQPLFVEVPAQRGVRITSPGVPPGEQREIIVDGLDRDGIAISMGKSGLFRVTADSPERVEVAFARCQGLEVFRDGDGDLHGADGSGRRPCYGIPPGFVDRDGDCDDQNPEVHSDQKEFQDAPRRDGSFDYNCDGAEEMKWPMLDCTAWGADCIPKDPGADPRGWTTSPEPGTIFPRPVCGKEVRLFTCTKSGTDCVPKRDGSDWADCR